MSLDPPRAVVTGMPMPLKLALTITDCLFIAYWTLAALDAASIIEIPEAWLYANAHEPRVDAVRLAQRGDQAWRPMALVSLLLTMVAGGMAVSYWTLLKEFDPAWFLPNLALFAWPLFFIGNLVCPSEPNKAAAGGSTT
jgi:Family of unknown function (DUF5360)